MRVNTFVRGVVALCAACTFVLAVTGSALASKRIISGAGVDEPAPGWMITTRSYPTHLVPGEAAVFAVRVYNIGAAESQPGATVVDTLPTGVTSSGGNGWSCSAATPVVCDRAVEKTQTGAATLVSTEQAEYRLPVTVGAGVTEGTVSNAVSVSGGGAAQAASVDETFTVSAKAAGFGFADAEAWAANANGTLDTEPGSHPFAFTFTFDMDANVKTAAESEVRNMTVNLPPGLVGNATAVPRCTREEFDEEECPTGSQIGIAPTILGKTGLGYVFQLNFPVYNIVPPPGHPAEFGLQVFNNEVFLDASVRSGGDYGITENVTNIPQREIISSDVTVWGVPASQAHDAQRVCRVKGVNAAGCSDPEGEVPFLTLPTSCSGPEEYSAIANEWFDGKNTSEIKLLTRDQNGRPSGLSGCGGLHFDPEISAAPDTSYADAPAGLTAEVNVSQEALTATSGVATANIKNTTVTLPEGVAINPGQAAGLSACQPADDGIGTEGPPACPSSSRVGTDEIETPLVFKALKGNVYVLQSNPPNLKLLVAASGEGVNVKLLGDVHLDEQTGQLVTTFSETPELPFTTFRLAFNGGAQAALTTPLRCGAYATDADFTPWSTPFTQDAASQSQFLITGGPGGSACINGTLPFAPELIAGSTTDQAGAYTGFSLLLQRGDGQQRIEKLQFKAPAGLSGMLASVSLCGEPQAADGTCTAASQIGHSVVSSGPGPYPLVIPQPGQPESPIYLTGPYDGAPFGLSIVTHVIAGPFNLGTIVTRAKIEIDPHTAQITVTTDPLPQVLDGVPTNLRLVDAVIDRPGFMFNPTSCEPTSFSGTAWGAVPPGAGGASSAAPISSRFQVGSCRGMAFKPKLTAQTKAHHTRRKGAYFHVTVSSSAGQANIKEVHVELPRALPSVLKTLQKACTEEQFAANPAGCPAESIVGHAVIHTPVLPVALTGPAYFVSHGGAKFPELVMVLQGDGVTIELDGETFISKKGVTSSTFRSVPDQPFTRFDLVLPQTSHPALGGTANFCKHALKMPTRIVGQNGARIEHVTKVKVTGCGQAKKAGKKHRRHHGHKAHGKHKAHGTHKIRGKH